ncbi:hypothetical protein IQ268_11135 [Oculatella sp. LEGE 06141]|uniref:hypothetical protein n=1 Tax=Oculatella sp. LEGE 06141 TaxID=1828648 RepID=UPI00187F9684|nr:hypothetical protein [Oculatella sp. LEGE 06141]MBE9179115.1 hypothetical protein [Oculatella sp. LEGE 06141]
MPKHSELSGADLHETKLTLGAPPTAPSFVGQTRFHNGVLFIGTGTTAGAWSPCYPQIFDWALETAPYAANSPNTITSIGLYWHPLSNASLSNIALSSELVNIWIGGDDWGVGAPINFTEQITQMGAGIFTFLISGEDAYGGSDKPLHDQRLELVGSQPTSAAEVIEMANDFKGMNGEYYSNIRSVRILEPFSLGRLRIVNA